MAYQNYDQYGQSESQGLSIKGIAGTVLNPIEMWKYQFLMSPDTYSLSKGMRAPWGPKASARVGKFFKGLSSVDSAKAMFTPGSGLYSKGAKTIASSATGFGAERVGAGVMRARGDYLAARKVFRKATDMIGLKGMTSAKVAKNVMGDILKSGTKIETIDDLRQVIFNNVKGIKGLPGDVVRANVISGSVPHIKAGVGGVQLSDDLVKAASKVAGIKGGKAAVNAGMFMKGGMVLGKGVSIIGMASLVWDIGMMVGRPLGKALGMQAHGAINSLFGQYDQEFGGALSMSYLSRGAATERQRALQGISKSYINGRAAMGQEAAYAY